MCEIIRVIFSLPLFVFLTLASTLLLKGKTTSRFIDRLMNECINELCYKMRIERGIHKKNCLHIKLAISARAHIVSDTNHII